MSSLTRREFLAILAAAGVTAVGSGWYTNRLFAMVEDGTLSAPRGAGIETWVPTACRLCPAACGMRVRLVDGLPVGLEGNRTDPVTAGGLCPAGFSALQEMVHPDRLRSPMRRDGPRGSGRWTTISWDAALEQIATSLRRLRQDGKPEAFAVLERGDSALTRAWIEHVMQAYGSPNLVLDGNAETWHAAWSAVAGVGRAPAVDLANSDFVLSFGHELFETDGHPVWQTKAWGRLRSPSVPRPASLVYVGPRVSPTAAHADLHVAIHPGQEATFALGLVHVLMMEDMLNRTFLDRWTEGFASSGEGVTGAAGGFENFIRRHYTPEEVSRRTGASVGEIQRVGRAFGSARRPVAMVGPAVLHAEGGLAAAMSIVALNMVVGALGRAGGYVTPGFAPLALPPRAEPDAVARRGLAAPRVDGVANEASYSSPLQFMQNVADGKPYPLDVLLIHGVNPAHEWPGGADFGKAIEHIGLVVATAQVPDETAALADVILPETSFLEAWGLLRSAHALPLSYAVLQQPAVPPLYESRSFDDIWFALARRMGGAPASAIPAGSYGDWLPEAAAGLYRAGRGTISSGAQRERIADFVESRGWKLEGPESASAFWQALREFGSWVDAPSVDRTPAELLGNGTARFQFWPQALISGTAGDETIYDRFAGAAGQRLPEAGPRGDYPLDLLVFETNTIWRGRTALTPLLLELTGPRENIAWDSWVEIHPTTAKRHGVRDGARVGIESRTGRVTARVRVTSVVPPDAVAMPRGLGHHHFGRFANDVGVNAMSLIPARVDPSTGAALLVTRVRFANART